ncbi:hypothetical protein Bca101_026635 [Brassica carinata]
MARMINYMPTAWRVCGRVRGVALSRDRFQFIFQREEDLITVLKDRPWSYNHWTLLLERWCSAPPRDFLTTLEVWIRIRNLPVEHYTSGTMFTLAKKIGKVEEIAYDPNVSQTTDYIRAKVTLNVENPAFEAKNLHLPSGEITIITYEYEKIHKLCFSCFRLTHEKSRCPYAKRKQPVAGSSKPPLLITEPSNDPHTSRRMIDKRLDGPPGFPAMFPELSDEEQRAALQYISHADETERNARISCVRQSIEESPKIQDVMLRISHELNKDKGHVFNYNSQAVGTSMHSKLGKAPAVSLPDPRLATGYESENSVEQSSSSNFKVQGATVFRTGSSVPSVSTGTLGSKKRDRKRPSAWVRRTRANTRLSSSQIDGSNPSSPPNSAGKRKADNLPTSSTNKATKAQMIRNVMPRNRVHSESFVKY